MTHGDHNPRPAPPPGPPIPIQPAPPAPPGESLRRANPIDPALGPALLQAPWRHDYLTSMGARERVSGPPALSSGSFLRDYWLDPASDQANHVIARDAHGMILLNAFPYANGHLLAALGEGRPRLLDYSPDQRAALWRLTDLACDLMERALQPQGVNIGVNQGRAAGAGVPQHVHVHLVPRWGGDVNFMTVVGRVRVIPSSLEVMAETYRAAWNAMRTGPATA
ncbi:MAG: HIT domain-containing protein [Phycisphaerae bacterium]|nr:HIT domain-containing protein [Phycisphaerae bacterium]